MPGEYNNFNDTLFLDLENDDVTCNPRIEYCDTEKKKNKQ